MTNDFPLPGAPYTPIDLMNYPPVLPKVSIYSFILYTLIDIASFCSINYSELWLVPCLNDWIVSHSSWFVLDELHNSEKDGTLHNSIDWDNSFNAAFKNDYFVCLQKIVIEFSFDSNALHCRTGGNSVIGSIFFTIISSEI